MADPFRGGGFGGFGGNPFQRQGSNLSGYLIGGSDDGSDIAYLDKISAANAWKNGQLTDAAYLEALQRWVDSTDAGSSQREGAEQELLTTTISIGRARIVRDLNKATTPAATIRELLRLTRYDRAQLKKMDRGTTAYQNQLAQIEGNLAQVRTARFGRLERQYNNGQLTTDEMLKHAQRFARNTRGKQDHRQYRDLTRRYSDNLLTEQTNDAQQAWNDDPTAGNAAILDKLYAEALGRAQPGTPAYKSAAKRRDAHKDAVQAYDKQVRRTTMKSRAQNGEVSQETYLDFLKDEMDGEEKGTPAYIDARDTYNGMATELTEFFIQQGIEDGSRDPGDLIDFYQSQMFWMDPGSPQAIAYQNKISAIHANGYEALNLMQGAPGSYAGAAGGGHLVYPGELAPGGRPVGKKGFASQFDETTFANTNCGMASAAMLAWAVSGGDVKVSGGDMRYYSGDREGGTNVGNVVDALDGVGIQGKEFRGTLSLAGFRKRLKNGKPAVLAGISGATSRELQMGYGGPHSVYVDHVKEKNGKLWYYVMDPLGRNANSGRYWDEANINAFGFANGQIEGHAAFAGKGGNTKKSGKMRKTQPPPQQSFDTDWNGQGTQGKGGGTSRAEAGPPKDWSHGKTTRPSRSEQFMGTDDTMVSKFLAAVGRIEEETREYGEQEGIKAAELAGPSEAEDARTNRAFELLSENDGDPRRAAVEWFTGIRPGLDAAEWSQTARHYANAVGPAFNLEKVGKKGNVILPGSPEQPIAAQPGEAPVVPGAPESMVRGGEGPPQLMGGDIGTSPESQRVARDLLDRLGIVPTNDAVRMTASWLFAETGGQIEGNNPLNLKTMGNSDLPGQVAGGMGEPAIFDTYEEGLDATADIMEQDAPGVIAALRGSDAELFTEALADSNWSENPQYGNLVTQTFNTINAATGGRPIINNTGARTRAPSVSLADASTGVPDLVELLDVDFTDPHQQAWFGKNADAAELALRGDQATWTYVAPDGRTHEVETTRGIVNDVLELNMEYVNATAPMTQAGTQAMVKADQRLNNTLDEVDYRNFEREMTGLEKHRAAAERQGRWGDALDIEDQIGGLINNLMQQPPEAPLDIYQSKNTWLHGNASAFKYVSDMIDTLEPFTGADASDPNAVNTRGSRIRALVRDGLLIETIDPDSGVRTVQPNRAVAFTSQDAQGNNTIITKQTDPDLFEDYTAQIENPMAPGETTEIVIPVYAAPDSEYQRVSMSDGSQVWLKPTIEENPLVTFWNREFEGVSFEIERTMNPAYSEYQQQLEAAAMEGGNAVRDFQYEQWKKAVRETDAFGRIPSPGADVAPPQWLEEEVRIDPDPDDALLTFGGIHPGGEAEGLPTISKLEYVDPSTGSPVTGWSIDGAEWTWRFGETSIGASPPSFVLNPSYKAVQETDDAGNVSWVIEGLGPDPDWGEVMYPYGTPDTHTGNPVRAPGDLHGIGGMNQQMLIKQSVPAEPGFPQVIDAAFTPVEFYRTGQIGVGELMARAQGDMAQNLLIQGGPQEVADVMQGGANVAADAETYSTAADQINSMLGVPPTAQTDGPNANYGQIDPNLSTGMQAQAASAQLAMAEAQAREAEAQKIITAQQAAAAAQAPAVPVQTPPPERIDPRLDPGQFEGAPMAGGQQGATKPVPGPEPGPPPRKPAPPPPTIEGALATLQQSQK